MFAKLQATCRTVGSKSCGDSPTLHLSSAKRLGSCQMQPGPSTQGGMHRSRARVDKSEMLKLLEGYRAGINCAVGVTEADQLVKLAGRDNALQSLVGQGLAEGA